MPNYNALLLRKTYPQLAGEGGLIDRSKEWLSGKAEWNETKHRWTFPSGAILRFGHLHKKDSHFDYQGLDYDFIGFDELTHFDESQYRYLFSRLRKSGESPIPSRMRAASNPGGRGHTWVKRRFIEKLPDPNDEKDTLEKCRRRIFIPAKVADNPGLNVEEYLESLGELDAQTLKQLRDGDWDARGDGNWIYPEEGITAAAELGRLLDGNPPEPSGGMVDLGIDWGENTVGLLIWPLERGGIYVADERVFTSQEPGSSSATMLNMAGKVKPPLRSARYDAAGVQSMRTFLTVARQRHPRLKATKIPFSQYKVETINYLRRLFERTARGETTQVIAISPTKCPTLLQQLRHLEWDDPDLLKVQKEEDHAPDALIAGAAPIAAGKRKRT